MNVETLRKLNVLFCLQYVLEQLDELASTKVFTPSEGYKIQQATKNIEQVVKKDMKNLFDTDEPLCLTLISSWETMMEFIKDATPEDIVNISKLLKTYKELDESI